MLISYLFYYIYIYEEKKAMKNYKKYSQKQVLGLLSGLLFCILLLSACDAPKMTQASSTVPSSFVTERDSQQLQTYQEWISQMQQSGGDVTKYRHQFQTDQAALNSAKTAAQYKKAQNTLDLHISDIQIPVFKTQIKATREQLQQKVTNWRKEHTFTSNYDGHQYAPAYEYDTDGIQSTIEEELSTAQTIADYQFIADEAKNTLINFEAMVDNTNDKTPYDQAHKTDLSLLKRYNANTGKAIVISLGEQAIRVYNQGEVVKAFLATTGRPTRPSLPGKWFVEDKATHIVFKSGVPVGSPDYYPDTPITYALQYHKDGYFIHDSYWRNDYGPGTNFPHQDSSGCDCAATGSHGCVNMPTEQTAWVYDYAELYTPVIIY